MSHPRPANTNDEYSLLKMPKVTQRSLRQGLADYMEATRTGLTIDGQPVPLSEVENRTRIARNLAAYLLARG